MVKLNRIYTRTGDDGTTGLADGSRAPKDDLRIAAYGTVDELNAVVGMARQELAGEEPDPLLARIQNELFDLGADLATPGAEGGLRITPDQVRALEAAIDGANERLQPLESFVLPGGSALSARLHLARTVCRRAERALVSLARRDPINLHGLHYLNRLSDLFFVLARVANDDGAQDVLWVPGGSRDASGG
jgi:cob(I)alamin adenosyltransferase